MYFTVVVVSVVKTQYWENYYKCSLVEENTAATEFRSCCVAVVLKKMNKSSPAHD